MERRGQEQRGLDRAGAGRLYEAVDLGVPISPGTLVVDLQVQLLISAQDVENYKVIKSELDRLRTMVEKSELWVDKKGTSKGEEGEAGPAKDKKEVCGVWGPGQGPGGLGLADPAPPFPQRPTDEEGFLHPPGEKSSENYQIVKGVSGRVLGVGLQAPCPRGPMPPLPPQLQLARRKSSSIPRVLNTALPRSRWKYFKAEGV